jgi:hypothetical protein
MSINICRSSVKTFYVCTNCSRANAVAFNVVLFVKLISFFLIHLCICLFVCQIGWTPLHRASYYGHIEVVRLLLDRGADIQAQTEVSEG